MRAPSSLAYGRLNPSVRPCVFHFSWAGIDDERIDVGIDEDTRSRSA